MHIRKTSLSDTEDILRILSDASASLKALGLDQWQNGYPGRKELEADIARGESYVVINEEGNVIASGMISMAGEPDYDTITEGSWLTESSSDHPTYAVVHRLAVSRTAKKRGVASFFFAEAEHKARLAGMKSMRIDTHEGNTPMRSLLTKCGFHECGIIILRNCEEGRPERIAYEKVL